MYLKFFNVVLFFTMACSLSESTFAETAWDLDRCRYKDGGSISPDLCLKLRNSELRFKEKKANDEKIRSERREAARIEDAERKIKRVEEDQKHAQKIEERNRLEAERIARQQKQYEAEVAEDERRERIAAKKQAQIIEEKKALCGDDYGQAKIGMSLARAQQCVAKFKLSSEINRADGIISTYTAGAMYIHVMNGRIVSWGR